MTKYIVVFVTCSSRAEAIKIAKSLLKARLIACANIIGGVKSLFWWKGKIDEATETLMIIKTVKKNYSKIKRRIKEIHSYEVPEIIAMPITAGNREYLKWISGCVK